MKQKQFVLRTTSARQENEFKKMLKF